MNALDRNTQSQRPAESSDRNAGELRSLARRIEVRSSDRAMFERAIEAAKTGHSPASRPRAPSAATGPQATRRLEDDEQGMPEWARLNQTARSAHSGFMQEHDRQEPATGCDGGTSKGREGCVGRLSAAAANSAPAAQQAHATPAAPNDQLGRFLAPTQTEGRWTFELAGGDLPLREFSLERHRFSPTQVTLRTQDLVETRLQPPLQRLRDRLAEMGASLEDVHHDEGAHAGAGSDKHAVEDEA